MSRVISTGDLHNIVTKRKMEYGKLATLVDNIVEEMVEETPTANAIEREKIDKAIEVANDYISTTFKLGLNERAFGMREILEVFMKNIGGNND